MPDKPRRRYNGVYMASFYPPDSRIRYGQYFPGTRAASKALGHRRDLLRREILKNRDGCSRGMGGLDGFVFITAQLAYELDWK